MIRYSNQFNLAAGFHLSVPSRQRGEKSSAVSKFITEMILELREKFF